MLKKLKIKFLCLLNLQQILLNCYNADTFSNSLQESYGFVAVQSTTLYYNEECVEPHGDL